MDRKSRKQRRKKTMSEKEKETGEIEERDGFIAIPDGSLYYKKYDIQGKVGLPVVLLHGNRGTHRDFSDSNRKAYSQTISSSSRRSRIS